MDTVALLFGGQNDKMKFNCVYSDIILDLTKLIVVHYQVIL